MELRLVNRLAMIGIATVAINGATYSTTEQAYEIQEKASMDMYDVMQVEKLAEERKRYGEKRFDCCGYTFIMKN